MKHTPEFLAALLLVPLAAPREQPGPAAEMGLQ
jgi:hypothetical protein